MNTNWMPGALDDQILLAEIPDNVVEDIQLLHQDLQGAAHQEDPLQPLQPFSQEAQDQGATLCGS